MTSSRLPQLAVSAKILCLLMVVICGAVPTERLVRLYSQCSEGHVRVYPNGTVLARGTENREEFQNLTFISKSMQIELLIYAPEADMYLCFNNRWKLVGRKIEKKCSLQKYTMLIQRDHGERLQHVQLFVSSLPLHGLQQGGRTARPKESPLPGDEALPKLPLHEQLLNCGSQQNSRRRKFPYSRKKASWKAKELGAKKMRHENSRHPRKKRPHREKDLEMIQRNGVV